MDDMWDVEVWNKIKCYFPNNENGSRIVITTRQSKLALHLCGTYCLKMNFLDDDKSWNSLCKIVFGEESCLSELEEIGKKIAKNCKGLPLSIAVIGGLLATSNGTLKYWEYVEENLNSILSLEDDERCLRILYTSYSLLPVHLKSCFLYMGIFPEDSRIRVSELIKLWVAEGFLKPISGKSLEECSEEYLMDLIDRNLILISERGSSGKVKFCNIHDLLRDLCLKEARKQKFPSLSSLHSHNIPGEDINAERHIVLQQCSCKEKYLHSLKSESITRALICHSPEEYSSFVKCRLLRVLKTFYRNEGRRKYSLEAIFQLVNSGYLAIRKKWGWTSIWTFIFPSSVTFFGIYKH